MWLIVLFTLLCVLFIISLVAVGFLVKALTIQLKKNDIYEKWIRETQNRVEDTYKVMQRLDRQQMFSKDDDVGEAFQKIVEVVDYLNSITTRE